MSSATEVYDPVTEQTVPFTYEPHGPVRGTAEGQTPGCYCPRCSDSDDYRPCLHAGREMSCYCPGCADPEHPGDSCWNRGKQTCDRCGRRDWASLAVPYNLCGRCCYAVYHSGQTDLSGWSA